MSSPSVDSDPLTRRPVAPSGEPVTPVAPAAGPADGPGRIPVDDTPRRSTDRDPLPKLVWRSITPLGRTALALGIVCWVLAAVFGWMELAVIAVACLFALLVGVAMLLTGTSDLAVTLNLTTRRVVVGEPASTEVNTLNRSRRRMLPTRMETRVGKGVAKVNVPSLASGAQHDELFMIPTNRRSVLPVGPVRSVQGDPLGLVRREVLWTGVEELFVHPRTVRLSPLAHGLRRDLEGETTNHRSPSDVAFHTLREYAVGDDRRHIHWRTTARQADGKLMVREFVDTRRAQVAVVICLGDDDWSDQDSFELGVSAVASVGLRALADDQELLCLTGGRSVPAHGRRSLLDGLARIERGDDDWSLASIVRRSRDLLSGASVAVLVVGSRSDLSEAQRAATSIGLQTETVVLVVDAARVSGRRGGSVGTTFELGALEDLPRVLAGVGS